MASAPKISARDAYESLASDADAVLVDVRTPAEWTYVGVPDLNGLSKDVVRISWQDTSGNPNPSFVDDLRRAGIAEDQPVMFLCRSGGRSQSAADAALAEGFENAVNVAGGFEGPPDENGRRGTVDGWKAADLPWRQG